jgi:hypothetical protein
MTRDEYQAQYDNIERAVVIGAMTWKQGMAKAALLSIEFTKAQYAARSLDQIEDGLADVFRNLPKPAKQP